MNITKLLTIPQQRLEETKKITDELKRKYPQIFEDEEGLFDPFNDFLAAYKRAENRLAFPAFSIATLGTTSSGKSTVVNALIGKRIAPIEAKEMSGGVLTLRHSLKRRLTVKKVEDSSWDSGTWENISDEDAYSKCKQVMIQYHQARKEKVEFAPEITYEGPLLPGSEPNLLGLPKELSIEFIDLPGLKSVQDRKNLAVIQSKVEKAFNLVVLDYNQTDEAKRKKLLEELQRTVEFLAGRSDLMIFVLNRVDSRGRDDEPLEERIELLRKEIKNVLKLKKEPEIIPLTARLLYNAQCAWGAGPAEKNDSPLSLLKNRKEHLEALFEDCATSLKRLGKTDKKIRKKLRQLEDTILDDDELPSEKDLQLLLHQQRDWSGGTKLWSRLHSRLGESFAELVLAPILMETLLKHSRFLATLRSTSEIRKTKNKEELERSRQNIEKTKTDLHENVDKTTKAQNHDIKTAIKELRKKTTGKRFEAENILKILGKGFLALVTAVDDVVKDLKLSLVQTMRKALKNKRGVFDLEDELKKILTVKAANRLARSYDIFKVHLYELKNNKKQKTYSISVREDDKSGKKESLEGIRRDLLRLYKNMRECLASRAEFLLQGKMRSIRQALLGLLNKQTENIKKTCLSQLQNLSIKETIESARLVKSKDQLPELPVTLFQLPTVKEEEHRTEREVVGTRYKTKSYTTGSCLKKRHYYEVKKDVYGTVAYRDLVLPNADAMAEQWIAGIEKVEDSLWKTLQDWMIEALEKSSKDFFDVINTILGQADRAFEKQQQLVKNEFEQTLALWTEIDLHIGQLQLTNEKLSKTMKTKTGSEISLVSNSNSSLKISNTYSKSSDLNPK